MYYINLLFYNIEIKYSILRGGKKHDQLVRMMFSYEEIHLLALSVNLSIIC